MEKGRYYVTFILVVLVKDILQLFTTYLLIATNNLINRIGYCVYLLEELIERYHESSDIELHFLYDIGCMLKRHLQVTACT